MFRGTYKGEPVAVKMTYVVELTAEDIAKFVHEANELHKVKHHPNVVTLFGDSSLFS